MKRKSALVFTILLLAVGFAAVSTTLVINGSVKVGENTEDFSVIFTKASLDGTDVYANIVDDTKKIINFSTNELKTLNQTSVLNYEVTNNSSNYDAEVQVTCKLKDGGSAKYTSIKNELEGNATIVKAKESLNGTLTVNLKKTATEEVNEQYVCELTFNAVERTQLGNNPAIDKLISLANSEEINSYENGNKNQLYVFKHEQTEQTEALSDYRFIGENPYNYIEFSGETWRILGIFDIDGEKKIKIIKNDTLDSSYAWDTNGKNNFITSSLNNYLNGNYYESLDKNYISKTKVYLGGTDMMQYVKANEWYSHERSNRVYSGNPSYYNDAYVSLMYPSDFAYTYAYGIDNECFNNGFGCDVSSGRTNSWMYIGKNMEAFITPDSSSSNQIYRMNSSSGYNKSTSSTLMYIRPVVYLNSNVKFVSGDGTSTNPYKLYIR